MFEVLSAPDGVCLHAVKYLVLAGFYEFAPQNLNSLVRDESLEV